MSEYPEIDDDGLRLPKGKYFLKLACCDCGLTHRVYYDTTGKEDYWHLYMDRDNRATGQLRRHHEYVCAPQKTQKKTKGKN